MFYRKPFWIAGVRIFSALLYYLIVVPVVFVIVAVPTWIALDWIGGEPGGERTTAFAVLFALFIIGARYWRRRREPKCAVCGRREGEHPCTM